MGKKLSKQQALDALQEQYSRLEAVLETLPRRQMRTAKEMLAHLTAWDRRGMLWIGDAARGETPKIPAPNETWSARHRFNAEIQKACRRRSFESVLDEYRATFDQLVELVESVDERAWHRALPVQHKYGVGAPIPLSELVGWRVQHIKSHMRVFL